MAYLIQIAAFIAAMFAAVSLFDGTPFHNKFAYAAVGIVAAWLVAQIGARLRH